MQWRKELQSKAVKSLDVRDVEPLERRQVKSRQMTTSQLRNRERCGMRVLMGLKWCRVGERRDVASRLRGFLKFVGLGPWLVECTSIVVIDVVIDDR